MSISRLSSDVLGQVISFLPLEDAHKCAGGSKALNQAIHTPRFSSLQLQRLFPGQAFASPVAEYQKIVRIFANFAAGRCSLRLAAPLPAGATPVPSCSLGSFRLLSKEHTTGDTSVLIEGRGGVKGRIPIWDKAVSDIWDIAASGAISVPSLPSLFPASEAGSFIVTQPWKEFSRSYHGSNVSGTMHWQLDFSLPQEEILFDLARQLSIQPDQDAPDASPQVGRFKRALSQRDRDAIYREFAFIQHSQQADYGKEAFESFRVCWPWTGRRKFIPNKDRADAILNYSMRLIARRYAAPHGDPLAEDLFNRLPLALRNPVYGELRSIKPPQQNEDVWNYGELAFHGRLGTVTNLERRTAILNFVDSGQKVM